MRERLQKLLRRHSEIVLYLVFGALTTLVNIAAYYVLSRWLRCSITAPATLLAWLLSVLFAYATNRKWVFQSRAQGLGPVGRELAAFFGARALSGLLDLGIMALLVDVRHLPDLPVKIGSNVLVVVLNYLFSKFWIFRRSGDRQ